MNTLFGRLPSTNCSCCGRTLTDPTSVRLGIGPICRGARGMQDLDSGDGDDELCDYALLDPIEAGIVLRRDELGVHTNVPHLVTHHSPNGYEFGYGGSGPADLALNIVELVLRRMGYEGPTMKCHQGECLEEAWRLHQAFKFDFVAGVERQGGIIPYDTVVAWVTERVEAA